MNMAPRPITRQHYIDYEITARTRTLPRTTRTEKAHLTAQKKLITAQSIKRWVKLSAEQKQKFVKELLELREREETLEVDRRRVRRDADGILQLLPPVKDARAVDWATGLAGTTRQVPEFEDLVDRQQKLVDARLAFLQVTTEVYADVSAELRRHDLDLDTADQVELDLLQESLAQWRDLFKKPRLPPRAADDLLKCREIDLPEGKKRSDGEVDRKQMDWPEVDYAMLTGTSWEGGWPVNPGCNSVSAVWLRFDTAGKIVDRMLRKQVYQSRRDWADATKWVGDVHDANARVPVEVSCLQDLAALPEPAGARESINFTRMRMQRVDDWVFRYTIYLDYCAWGDLEDLILEHKGPRSSNGTYDRMHPIGEPFLWCVFHSLAKIGMAMQYGSTDASTPRKDWKQIVHRDLRPANIFLDGAFKGFFEVYPVPRLGDFGCAIRTHDKDMFNPAIYQDQPGASGFLAPEQTAYVDYLALQPVDRFMLGSWTNVWSAFCLHSPNIPDVAD